MHEFDDASVVLQVLDPAVSFSISFSSSIIKLVYWFPQHRKFLLLSSMCHHFFSHSLSCIKSSTGCLDTDCQASEYVHLFTRTALDMSDELV